MPPPRVLLEIGRVVKPHGIRGELVVDLVTNVEGRLRPGVALECRFGDGLRPMLVRTVRPHQHRFLVMIEGVTSLEQAETWRGGVLLAEPLDAPDALFVHELIGARLVERSGRAHGHVVAVEANPASDLLVLKDGQLVPLRFVVERRPGEIVVEVPDGLLE
jgi:16S rRNA processing protein RimM